RQSFVVPRFQVRNTGQPRPGDVLGPRREQEGLQGEALRQLPRNTEGGRVSDLQDHRNAPSLAVRRSLRRAACLGLVSTIALAFWAAAGDAAAHPAKQQLGVAIVIPKSGAFSIHNRLIANGATIATNEINAQGGDKGHVRLKLKVVGVKSAASPKRIVRSLARASTRVLILPCNVELQESLARAAAGAGLLTLSPCNPDANFAKTDPRYWPTGTTGAAEAMQLAFYAQSYAHAKTAFL